MINKRLLKEIVVQQRVDLLKKDKGLERGSLGDVEKYLKLPHILIISGVRRSGKSTLLTQIISKHFDDNFYYLNFEDERLISFSAEEDFDNLYQIFLELYGNQKTFFFDEVQNISGWERFVRRMYDKNFKFFITGSNARLLSKELATHLTGRHLMIELYPFSFREFLKFKKIEVKQNFEYLPEEKAKLKRNLFQYLKKGGFPEYLRYKENEILHRIFNDIIFRDIIVRYSIRETKAFQEIVNYLMANISNTISYNRLKNMFNLGSVNTTKNFTEYLENSFLMFFVNQFSYSTNKQTVSPKKVYCVDTGLRNIMSFRFSEDNGRLAENLVFIELKRRRKEIYYWKSAKTETDFVIKEGMKIKQLIQICWNIEDKKTKEREIKGLLESMKEFHLRTGLIITEDYFGEEKVEGKKIKFVPLWKWLLED